MLVLVTTDMRILTIQDISIGIFLQQKHGKPREMIRIIAQLLLMDFAVIWQP